MVKINIPKKILNIQMYFFSRLSKIGRIIIKFDIRGFRKSLKKLIFMEI
jgi:hypothetical protein